MMNKELQDLIQKSKILLNKSQKQLKQEPKKRIVSNITITEDKKKKIKIDNIKESFYSEHLINVQLRDTIKNRVCWVEFPKNTTLKQIESFLEENNCCIYKKISFNIEDVLSLNQKSTGNYNKSKFIIPNSKPIAYSQNFFSREPKEDVDYRNDNSNRIAIV